MKRIFLSLCVLCWFMPFIAQAQQLKVLQANSVKVGFNNVNNDTLKVFLCTDETDTVLFNETFLLLPRCGSESAFGGEIQALEIPFSYTGYSGCKAKSIFNNGDARCHFFSQSGEFETPLLP